MSEENKHERIVSGGENEESEKETKLIRTMPIETRIIRVRYATARVEEFGLCVTRGDGIGKSEPIM